MLVGWFGTLPGVLAYLSRGLPSARFVAQSSHNRDCVDLLGAKILLARKLELEDLLAEAEAPGFVSPLTLAWPRKLYNRCHVKALFLSLLEYMSLEKGNALLGESAWSINLGSAVAASAPLLHHIMTL